MDMEPKILHVILYVGPFAHKKTLPSPSLHRAPVEGDNSLHHAAGSAGLCEWVQQSNSAAEKAAQMAEGEALNPFIRG